MTEPTPTPSAEPGLTRIAAWGVALAGACRAVDVVLAAQSTAAAVGQAVLVEWASSRLGVAWTRPNVPMTTMIIARRALGGALVGLGAAAIVFALLVAGGGAQVEAVPEVATSVIAIGFLTAAIAAWRDELLLHGIVLRALEGTRTHDVFRVLACGATSAGAALGRADASARSLVAAFALGLVFGALWRRDDGAWQPWAAHATFRFATATLLSGGVVHTRLLENAWAGGAGGMVSGTAAAVALLPLGAAAVVWTSRSSSTRGAIS